MDNKSPLIGITYYGNNKEFLTEIATLVSFIEISTDQFQLNGVNRNIEVSSLMDDLSALKCVDKKLSGSGLELGSYDGTTNIYLELLDELFYNHSFKAYQEKVSFTDVDTNNGGQILTLPKTRVALDIICSRIDKIQKRYKVPFVITNSSDLTVWNHFGVKDAEFLNQLSYKTGCTIAIDIPNLKWSKNYNHKSISAFINDLDIDHVTGVYFGYGFAEVPINLINVTDDRVSSSLNILDLILKRQPSNLIDITYKVSNRLLSLVGIRKVKRQLMLLDSIIHTNKSVFNPLVAQLILPEEPAVN